MYFRHNTSAFEISTKCIASTWCMYNVFTIITNRPDSSPVFNLILNADTRARVSELKRERVQFVPSTDFLLFQTEKPQNNGTNSYFTLTKKFKTFTQNSMRKGGTKGTLAKKSCNKKIKN